MENSHDTIRVIGALMVGAFLGAALGILFAPEKGSVVRGKIASTAKDLAEDLKRKLKEEASKLRNKANELEDLAEDKMDEMTDKI